MLPGTTTIDNNSDELADKIKREIISSLTKKGVDISQINVDLSSENVNVSVCINGKRI